MIIELVLPLPVTLNKLTHNNNSKNGGKGGRSKTKRAKEWYREASHFVIPFRRDHQKYCNQCLDESLRYFNHGKKAVDLPSLHEANMSLAYKVEYGYWFESERHKLPRDIANYEKQLSDFLVDMGFMVDDSFINDMRLYRAGTDSVNPRVVIKIEKINLFS
jgi:Holliday junction resolvase RusA-like endonuclease